MQTTCLDVQEQSYRLVQSCYFLLDVDEGQKKTKQNTECLLCSAHIISPNLQNLRGQAVFFILIKHLRKLSFKKVKKSIWNDPANKSKTEVQTQVHLMSDTRLLHSTSPPLVGMQLDCNQVKREN